jgi:RNA methyltransferase, TrmH family
MLRSRAGCVETNALCSSDGKVLGVGTELQQIGLHHPAAELVRDIQRNRTGIPRRAFVAEGLFENNIVLEAGVAVDTFLWCPEAAYSDEATTRSKQLAARARRAYRISAKTLRYLAERPNPDGLICVARLPDAEPETFTLGDDQALVLVIDGIEIPGNLGTLIRTADACAVDCLVLTNRRTRLTHPKVLRSSQGMSIRVPALEFDEVADAISWLDSRGFDVYLADTDDSRNYRTASYSGRTALVVGSERYGISSPWYAPGYVRVGIPMLGSADSLNVAISGAVLLYEARAQISNW